MRISCKTVSSRACGNRSLVRANGLAGSRGAGLRIARQAADPRGPPYHSGCEGAEPDRGNAGGTPRRPGARGGAPQGGSAGGTARAPNPARPAGSAGRVAGRAAGAHRHTGVSRRQQDRRGAALCDGLRLRGGASTGADDGLALTRVFVLALGSRRTFRAGHARRSSGRVADPSLRRGGGYRRERECSRMPPWACAIS